jgi:hypothetical protein
VSLLAISADFVYMLKPHAITLPTNCHEPPNPPPLKTYEQIQY